MAKITKLKENFEKMLDSSAQRKLIAKMLKDEKIMLIGHHDLAEGLKVHAYSFNKDEQVIKLIAGLISVHSIEMLK